MNPFFAEFIGTMILVLLGSSGVAASLLNNTKETREINWLIIAFNWGLAYSITAFLFNNDSGAYLNPAIVIAQASIGLFAWTNVPLYITAELMGAFFGSILVYFAFLSQWKKTQSSENKLMIFSSIPSTRHVYTNFISEIIGSFVLVLGILIVKFEDGMDIFYPLVLGILMTSILLSIGSHLTCSFNPAKDLASRVAHFLLPIPQKGSSHWKQAWVSVLGPIIGGIYGALFYDQFFSEIDQKEFSLTLFFWVSSIFILILFAYGFGKTDTSNK